MTHCSPSKTDGYLDFLGIVIFPGCLGLVSEKAPCLTCRPRKAVHPSRQIPLAIAGVFKVVEEGPFPLRPIGPIWVYVLVVYFRGPPQTVVILLASQNNTAKTGYRRTKIKTTPKAPGPSRGLDPKAYPKPHGCGL